MNTTRAQFRETILKHANHDYEETIRIYADTGNCLWCDNTHFITSEVWDDDSHRYQSTGSSKCPVCTLKPEDHE